MFDQTTLLNPPDEASWRQTIIDNLSVNGFDTSDWTEGSLQQLLLSICSLSNAQLAQMISDGVRLRTLNKTTNPDGGASGAALDSLSDSHFDNRRFESSPAIGTWVLSSSAGVGPITFQVGEIEASTIVNGNSVLYKNDDMVTVPLWGTATVSAISEDESSKVNASVNSTWTLSSGITGIRILNPPTSGSTWLSTNGRDKESDYSLTQRDIAKWSTLATSEVIEDRIANIVRNASSGSITQIAIDDSQPTAPFGVNIYCASDINVVTPDIATVSATQAAFWNGSNIINLYPGTAVYLTNCKGVTSLKTFYGFNVYVQSSFNNQTTIQSISDALDAYVNTLKIGGEIYPMYSNVVSATKMSRAIMSTNGVLLAYAVQSTGLPLDDEFISINTSNTSVSNAKFAKVVSPTTVGSTWNINTYSMVS